MRTLFPSRLTYLPSQLISKSVLCNETICNYTKLNHNQPYVFVEFLELEKSDWKKEILLFLISI